MPMQTTINFIVYNIGSFPEWITSVATLIALFGILIAFFEYKERTRPYIDIEIETKIENKVWNFFTKIKNKGQYPVYSKISKAILKIGDEKYPTLFENELVVFPNEEKTYMQIGSINEIGRKKIREAKYTSNTAEILLEISSRKIDQKDYKYKTTLRLQVLVEEDNPIFIILEKTFI